MTLNPEPIGVSGYEKFIRIYQTGLSVEQNAIDKLHEEK
jgi:hypothetical protein